MKSLEELEFDVQEKGREFSAGTCTLHAYYSAVQSLEDYLFICIEDHNDDIKYRKVRTASSIT